jgi:outer membrane cobalamin receptor
MYARLRKFRLHINSLFVILCIILFSFLIPPVARSNELSVDLTELNLEDLLQINVKTASKFEQKIIETPSSVTIITASDIEKYGYRTLDDVLGSVRGLYTSYDRNYNIFTKKGEEIKGFEFSDDAGSLNTYRGRISFGNKAQEGIEMLLSATYHDSKGDDKLYYWEFDAPETNNGIAEDSDIDRFHSFFGKASFRDFTLEAAFVNRKKRIPTAIQEHSGG